MKYREAFNLLRLLDSLKSIHSFEFQKHLRNVKKQIESEKEILDETFPTPKEVQDVYAKREEIMKKYSFGIEEVTNEYGVKQYIYNLDHSKDKERELELRELETNSFEIFKKYNDSEEKKKLEEILDRTFPLIKIPLDTVSLGNEEKKKINGYQLDLIYEIFEIDEPKQKKSEVVKKEDVEEESQKTS